MAIAPTIEGQKYLRDFAVQLLRDAELPHRQVTVLHRDILRRAGIAWQDGQCMASLLSGLSQEQLRSLIDQLRDDDLDEEE
ncbi:MULTISPECIES: hypothetical protein [Stenotrophomonas]|uniref:Uncharacterized protein n=1 Tax=Stenotrophomonas lactitubi TaxID=2045214 RepID=A0AAW4GD26_9GAMM|nr:MULTISPECIES: hypothetical protein [Stenotrophomonas]MBM9911900.1 hypothetical protein [Stenotrophomonas lactitubi]MBM9921062.1 hypothetical protein [Stenotrophomonas lactitubi]MBM9939875.1 hypothetical protein [Stenotrophomonas lactitubi]